MSRNYRHNARGSIHGYHLSARAVFATFRELLSRNLVQRKKNIRTRARTS